MSAVVGQVFRSTAIMFGNFLIVSSLRLANIISYNYLIILFITGLA
jgi:hypothetical protein